ncbi:MAG: AsmA-like C-terminal domain-containing protein [Planctomycetes bacterium]|nr:AsmA-like C-terminal domain-containing protein [Planctomycetota bacterium]MBU4398953.1 AsmA-like C-terminal domain-containing protein [Planctomycetota bacterium]
MPAIVVGAVAIPFLYRRVDEEIRCRVEQRIAEHYRGLRVGIRSARLVEGEGIRVYDLTIVDPGAEGPRAELLRVEEALLECSTDWRELVRGEIPIRRVTIRRPTLRAARRPDGTWSAGKLFPPPRFSDRPPPITVQGGTIEVFDPLKDPATTFTLRDLNFTLASPPAAEPGATSGARRLQGMTAGDGFRRVAFEGWVDFLAPACSIRGQAEGVNVSPELRDCLPCQLPEGLLALSNLRGEGNLRFELNYDPAAVPPLKFDVLGQLLRGRIDDPRLPHALTEIRASVRVDNGGVTIDDLTARIGQATLRMSCRRSGFEANAPLRLTAEVRQLELDRALLNILPQSLQDQWYKFLPAGRIDADARLDFDGQKWLPEISARYLNVSLTHHKFPYRLEHGKGTVELKDDVLKANLTAYSGSQPVRLTAEMAHPFSDPTGWFEAKGDNIQLDEALIAALPEKPRKVVRSLDPRGTVNFYARMWRRRPDEPMHKHFLVSPNRCSMRFDKFPYPLTNVRGTIEMLDDNWTFRNFEGTNDTARVTCEGHLTSGLQGKELVLNFVGRDVPLEEELRDALSPHFQQVWHDLRPRGMMDLTAEVRYLVERKQFSVGVRAQPQPQTASIEPVRFPYRLDRLEGVLLYRDGHVAFERCKAEHGPVGFAAEGYCDFQPDGRWHIRFERLSVDRLRADRELIQALPPRLKKALTALDPSGPMNLRGSLDLRRTERSGEPLHWQWDVTVGLQRSGLRCGGLSLENVCGEVSLRGAFDARYVRCLGELALDSISYKNFQLTEVKGPIWIDDDRVLFGSWVDRRAVGKGDRYILCEAPGGPFRQNVPVPFSAGPRTPRPITANLFGGKFVGDGWATLGPEPRYAVNATLLDADLDRCAREVIAGRQRLRGTITATADLTGRGWSRNSLAGSGTIRLSSGDVYELPVMISLLKILSIRPPDQNAFSDGSVDYRIEGEHVYFDQIDFRGDAISLRGKGEMDFQSAIKLTFYTIVGRGELELPVIKQVFRGASQQLMLIRVDGTLQNPKTRKEALPVVTQALQQLSEELQRK